MWSRIFPNRGPMDIDFFKGVPSGVAIVILIIRTLCSSAVAGDISLNSGGTIDSTGLISADSIYGNTGSSPPSDSHDDTVTAGLKTLTTHDSEGIHNLSPMKVYDKRPVNRTATAAVTGVNGDAIRRTTRTTPIEELSQSSAGIYVSSRGAGLHGISSGASGGIYIRGLGGSPNTQILVVEDGIPDYQGIFGHPIPDAFFPSLIERVSVIKGGDGVLYGTNAMGGVIVVEDRLPDSAGCRLENDAAFGSFNTFNERATLFYKGKSVAAVSAFSALTTDGHRDGTDGNSTAGQVGVRVQLPGSAMIIFRDKIVDLEGGDPGTVNDPHTDRRFDVIRNNASVRFEYPGEILALKASTWLNSGEHRLYDGFFSRDYTAGGLLEETGTLLDGKLQLLFGGTGEYIDGVVFDRISGEQSPVERLRSAGIYGQATSVPGAGITAVAGGRFHYSLKYGYVPLYKAGLEWVPAKAVSLRTRLTKNFRQPTLRELYLPFPVANPGLKPETAYNWDGGAEFRTGILRINTSVYKTMVTDMIKYFGMWPIAEVVNIDRVDVLGIESEITLDPVGPFSLFFSGCRQDVGRYTKQNPDAKADGRITYRSMVKKGMLELSITGEYVHGLYMNNYRRDRIDDVFFLDGSLRYRMCTGRGVMIEPYCIIRNFLNRRYEYILDYTMPFINFTAGLMMEI